MELKVIGLLIGLLIGAMILFGGLYYLIKDKEDKESRHIYIVTIILGIIIMLLFLMKLI